jgi:hypothetical protein
MYSSGALWAAPFDAKSAQLTGPAVVIAQNVAALDFFANYAVSATGTLVYAPGAGITPARNLFWVDRNGSANKIDAPALRPRLGIRFPRSELGCSVGVLF